MYLTLQDFSEHGEMLRQPSNSIPPQPSGGAVGATTTNKPENGNPVLQPPPVNERKTFCPSENKPSEMEANKAYGTFKTPHLDPPFAPVNFAVRKDSVGKMDGSTGKATSDFMTNNQSAVRIAAEHNNTTGDWTSMSQTPSSWGQMAYICSAWHGDRGKCMVKERFIPVESANHPMRKAFKRGESWEKPKLDI